MSGRKMHAAIVASASVVALLLGTTVAWATAGSDTDDNLSTAPSIENISMSPVTFVVTINGSSVNIGCLGLGGGGKITSGLSFTLTRGPQFGNCGDSLGGTETASASTVNGQWTVTEVDALNDETVTEPHHNGDRLRLSMPKDGVTIVSSYGPLSGCELTLSPNGRTGFAGPYNDPAAGKTGIGTVDSKPITVTSNSSCTVTSPLTISGKISPDPSFYDAG
jgi:hypothetical protein